MLAATGNAPARDQRVSAHHGVVMEGVLCFAQALVNGVSIVEDLTPPRRFTSHSVETAAHEVPLADGAPTESFCDKVPRDHFKSAAGFRVLLPDGREVEGMDLPRAKSRRQVPVEILARLEARARHRFAAPAAGLLEASCVPLHHPRHTAQLPRMMSLECR